MIVINIITILADKCIARIYSTIKMMHGPIAIRFTSTEDLREMFRENFSYFAEDFEILTHCHRIYSCEFQ